MGMAVWVATQKQQKEQKSKSKKQKILVTDQGCVAGEGGLVDFVYLICEGDGTKWKK